MGALVKPRLSILDKRFIYVNAASTNLAKTFERERALLAEQKARLAREQGAHRAAHTIHPLTRRKAP